ncbi:MAG: peptidylprolyl isomerase, partial [Verrucomicrobiota bacterium]
MIFRYLTLLALGLGLVGVSLAANIPPALSQTLPERNLTGVSQSFDLANFFTDPDVPGPAVRITVRRGTLGTGTIDVALDQQHTPLTVANFLRYINAGHYAGSFIHRSVPGFIIQGGGFRVFNSALQAVPTFAIVPNEPGVSNLRGTIAMAKVGNIPDSATNQWFINLANNSSNLDTQNGGFTAFGRVVGNGMVVADAVAAMPTFNVDPSNPNTPFTDLPLSTSSFTLATIVETSVAIIPTLTFTATSSNTERLTVSLSGSMLTLTPLAGANGPVTVTVSATDLDGGQFTANFAVNAIGPAAGPQPAGQAPTSINGSTFHFVVSGGSGIFSSSGSFLLLPATSGSTYVAIPDDDGEPSFGSFGYTKTATNTALISLVETNGSGTHSTQITGTFSTPSSGIYRITSPSSPGSSQTGSFVFSASSGQTAVQSPAAVGGLIFRLNITNGTTPFSGSGIGLLELSATNNTFDSLGIVTTASGSSSSGTYSYTKTGATTGRISMLDNTLGALTLTASFTGSSSGTAQVTAGAFPGSSQSANFIAYAILSEPVEPGFALMPADKTVVAGQVATFSVSATGTGPLTHQWQVSTNGGATFSNLTNTNGAAGATTATLSITTKAGAGDFGGNQYRCVVTNAAAAKTSHAATLTVDLAPKITAAPVGTIVNVNGNASFAVTVTGTPSPAFLWQRAPNGTSTFSNLVESETFSGVTSGTLSITRVAVEMNGDRFRVLLGNGVGSVGASSAATLTVRTPPTVTTPPVSKTVTSGQPVVFAVTAAGIGPLTFAWQRAPAGSVVFSTLTN